MSYSKIKRTEIILAAVFTAVFAVEVNLPERLPFHVFLILAVGTGVLFLAPILYFDHLEGRQYPQWKDIWKIPRALVILLVLTNLLMHRQVTTELMLIVFRVCMEICALGALCGEGTFSGRSFAVLAAITIAAAAAGMICYLKYYDLPPMTAFYLNPAKNTPTSASGRDEFAPGGFPIQ